MTGSKVAKLGRGAVTVARRRGVRYLGYLASGWLAPRLAYRFVYGPNQLGVFERVADAADLTVQKLRRPDELRSTLAALNGTACASVEELLDTYHARGVTGLRHAADRLTVGSGGWFSFAGLDGVRLQRRGGILWRRERDRDRECFNHRLGLQMLTETSARRALQAQRRKLPEGWFRDYAPIDFGGGLSVGSFIVTDSGTGRWDFFNGPVVAPLVRGQRVLDLGSNNGSLPLMMLRAGAREIVCVEQSALLAEAADLHRRILEWQDMKKYALRIHVGDMRDFLSANWGRFDVVTAFCSLYYLPDADMAAIVRHTAAMGATLVLQANEGARDIPASRRVFLEELMRRNGMAGVAVHEYPGFARPILVGTPSAAEQSLPAIA